MRIPTVKVTNGVETTGTWTNEFMSAMGYYGKQISVRVFHGNDTYTNDLIVSFRRYSDGALFKSVMYGVEIEFLGLYDFTGETFENIQFGVSEDGVTYYYVSFGQYHCTACEQNLEQLTTKAICYDSMLYAMKPYEITPSYPRTNSQFFNSVRIECGLERGSTIPSSDSSATNYSPIMAMQRQHETYTDKYTYRDVFDDFSEVFGGCIQVRSNAGLTAENLQLMKPTEVMIDGSILEINEDNLKTITIHDTYPEIRTVTLSRQPQGDNTTLALASADGYSEIQFNDNQIVEGYANNDRTPYLEYVLANVNEVGSFTPYEADSYGYVLLDPCDVFELHLTSGTYRCIWTGCDLTVTQGVSESATTTRPDETNADYTMSTAESKQELATYMLIDKVDGEIRSYVGDTLQNYSTIQQTNDAISLAVSQVDVPDENEIKSYAQAVLDSSGLEVKVGTMETDLYGEGGQGGGIAETAQNVETYFRFTPNGLEVGKENDSVIGLFSNEALEFYEGTTSGTRLAWLSASEGLGADELSIGDPGTNAERWRLIVSDDGYHFRITRHKGS